MTGVGPLCRGSVALIVALVCAGLVDVVEERPSLGVALAALLGLLDPFAVQLAHPLRVPWPAVALKPWLDRAEVVSVRRVRQTPKLIRRVLGDVAQFGCITSATPGYNSIWVFITRNE